MKLFIDIKFHKTDEQKDKEPETIHNTKSKTWIIIVSIIGGLILLAVIGLSIYCIKKRK